VGRDYFSLPNMRCANACVLLRRNQAKQRYEALPLGLSDHSLDIGMVYWMQIL